MPGRLPPIELANIKGCGEPVHLPVKSCCVALMWHGGVPWNLYALAPLLVEQQPVMLSYAVVGLFARPFRLGLTLDSAGSVRSLVWMVRGSPAQPSSEAPCLLYWCWYPWWFGAPHI